MLCKRRAVYGVDDRVSLNVVGFASRYGGIFGISLAMLVLAGCPKGNQEYNRGRKAEADDDYDSAVVHYDRALKADPLSREYRLKLLRMRCEAGHSHPAAGRTLPPMGRLHLALAELLPGS